MAARLDLTQAPYNVTQPWQGNDASAPDYTAAIQQAIDDLAAQNWGYLDTGGGDGGVIEFPPFVVSISDTLIMRDGIRFVGNNKAASRIMMRQNFPGTTPGKHMIDLGDRNSGHASFGGGIKDMHISARDGVVSITDNYTVYSNNVQDSGAIVDNCIIDGGSHFGGIKYFEGIGGASLVKFADVVAIARPSALALGNVPMKVKVSGSTMVEIDGFEPVVGMANATDAVAGSIGLFALGGSFRISRVHGEQVKYPIYFSAWGGNSAPRYPGDTVGSPATDAYCQAHVSWVTGGIGNDCLVFCDAPNKWQGKMTLDHLMLKSPAITRSFLGYGMTTLYGDVIDRIRI